MKAPLHVKRTVQRHLHDIVNDQRFVMHYRAIPNTVSHLEVFGPQGGNVSCIVNC